MNILTKIVNQKQKEVAKQKAKQPLTGFINKLKKSDRDFKKAISCSRRRKQGLSPTHQGINLIAELKKASPSAGLINKKFEINKIIKVYNKYASAISVLTDEKFFKGKLEYLAKTRKLSKLPILRKDFIIDEYQIYQSRLFGADAVLLIAAILSTEQINKFIKIAKKYKMDCLVEVHNFKELKKIIKTNAEIIGINNRDLANFKIDLNTTLNLLKKIPFGKIIVSESGIANYGDLIHLTGFHNQVYPKKVHAALVGTSLMQSDNLEKAMMKLLFPQVKICGLKTFTHAQAAAKAGADFLGFVFVKGRRRYIEPKDAKTIIQKIRKKIPAIKIVGVFQNEKPAIINEINDYLNLDFIQLHGEETPSDCGKILKPVIKAISVSAGFNIKIFKKYKKNVISFLLDARDGGRGEKFDWNLVNNLSTKYPVVLSGGLSAKNVKQAISIIQPQVVDVSSGVEDSNGVKSERKIREFVGVVKT